MTAAFSRAELTALGYVERAEGHWEKVESATSSNDQDSRRRENAGSTPAVAESPYRSKWEAERALLLANLKLNGQIADYRYEPMRLRLADGAWYKPDFLVEETDGTLTLEEVKGYWREAALVRYKVAKSLYPMFHFRAVTKCNGQWVDAMEGKR